MHTVLRPATGARSRVTVGARSGDAIGICSQGVEFRKNLLEIDSGWETDWLLQIDCKGSGNCEDQLSKEFNKEPTIAKRKLILKDLEAEREREINYQFI